MYTSSSHNCVTSIIPTSRYLHQILQIMPYAWGTALKILKYPNMCPPLHRCIWSNQFCRFLTSHRWYAMAAAGNWLGSARSLPSPQTEAAAGHFHWCSMQIFSKFWLRSCIFVLFLWNMDPSHITDGKITFSFMVILYHPLAFDLQRARRVKFRDPNNAYISSQMNEKSLS